MGRSKRKRVARMRNKIVRRAKRRWVFAPAPLLAASLPGELGVIRFRYEFVGTCIEGKITLP